MLVSFLQGFDNWICDANKFFGSPYNIGSEPHRDLVMIEPVMLILHPSEMRRSSLTYTCELRS